MDITPQFSADALVINGYGDDYFLLNGKKIHGNIYIYCGKFYKLDDNLVIEDILQSLDILPEIVLVGQGRGCFKPLREVQSSFSARRVAVEFMDTPSACRTYNILLAEGREVLAILRV